MADPALLSFPWHQVSAGILHPLLLLLSPLGSLQQMGSGTPLLCPLGFIGSLHHPRAREPTGCTCVPAAPTLLPKWGTVSSQTTARIINCVSLCCGTWLWTHPLPPVSKVSAVSWASGTNGSFIATHRQWEAWEAWIQHCHSWVTLIGDPVTKNLHFEVMSPTKY